MSRPPSDLSAVEQRTAVTLSQILSGRHSTKEEKEKAQLELDMIFERGFPGMIGQLRRRIEALEARVEACEGCTPPAPGAHLRTPDAPEAGSDVSTPHRPEDELNQEDPRVDEALKTVEPAKPSPPDATKRGPGRPSKRFRVEGSRGDWSVVSSTGVVQSGFKLKASAEEAAKQMETGALSGKFRKAGAIVDQEINEAPPEVLETAEGAINIEAPETSDDLFEGLE